jgi:hypothetical protein
VNEAFAQFYRVLNWEYFCVETVADAYTVGFYDIKENERLKKLVARVVNLNFYHILQLCWTTLRKASKASSSFFL